MIEFGLNFDEENDMCVMRDFGERIQWMDSVGCCGVNPSRPSLLLPVTERAYSAAICEYVWSSKAGRVVLRARAPYLPRAHREIVDVLLGTSY